MLSDPKKKQIYDTYGEEGLKQGAGGGGQPGGFDPNSIFEQFFGGGGGGGGGFRFNFGGGGFGFGGGDEETEDEFKGNDLRIPLTVTLEDLYNGKTLLVCFYFIDNCILTPLPYSINVLELLIKMTLNLKNASAETRPFE